MDMTSFQGMHFVAVCSTLITLGCSQNYSDKPAAEALSQKGLTPLAATGSDSGQPSAATTERQYDGSWDGSRQSIANVSVVVPEGWRSVAPSSSMRVAEYYLPGKTVEDNATVAIFAGNMGTVEGNAARWIGQFTETLDSQRRTVTVGSLTVTIVDVSGTFGGGMGPTAGVSKEDQRMLGAIVDVGDPSSRFLYIKLIGPQVTVAGWASSFDEFVNSISRI